MRKELHTLTDIGMSVRDVGTIGLIRFVGEENSDILMI